MQRPQSLSLLIACATFGVLTTVRMACAQSVVPLPRDAIPAGISADGSVAVGTRFDADSFRAFRWDHGVFTLLDEMPPVPGSLGTAVSANALHAAGADAATLGICGSVTPTEFYTASAWLNAGFAITSIGALAGDNWAVGVGVSDNAVIAGRSAFRSGDSRLCLYSFHSFRWTPGTGFEAIEYADPTWHLLATAISADGSLISGYAETLDGDRAFAFSTAGGVRALPAPAGSPPGESRAEDVSDTASFVVGSAARHACMWTAEGAPDVLALAPGVAQPATSIAHRVSGDGSVATGTMTFWVKGFPPQLVTRLFIWDRVRGARLLPEALEDDFGVDLSGVAIAEINDLSRTGRYLAIDGAIDGERRGLIIDLGRAGACAADVTLDGVIDSADFFAYLDAFFRGAGDVNEDGVVNSTDFFQFLSAFFTGC